MICLFIVLLDMIFFAFGFDFVPKVEALCLASILEVVLIDLPIVLFSGTKKEFF